MKIRVGFGFDVHKLVTGRELWLGGIRLEHEMGLLGHSDADVLIHAICDALLGAANMRDIGYHFPDNSADFKNIDSKDKHQERIHHGPDSLVHWIFLFIVGIAVHQFLAAAKQKFFQFFHGLYDVVRFCFL